MRQASVKTAIPGPRGAELLKKWLSSEADATGYQAPVVWKSAEGCVVTDVDGNKFLDWTSGVLVVNVGHCHPHLVEAVRRAAGDLLNNYECANTYRIEAAEKLVKALPPPLDRCFFLSSGSEATEASMRLMKRYTGKFEIISFGGGFHGRTPGAAAAGGLPGPKRRYGPTVPGVIRAPYPNPYRDDLGFCEDGPEFKRYFDFLEYTVAANSTGSLAGVIVEPYAGAGGFIFPPAGWLKRLREWARSNDLLFTLDEVQSSYGRTGTMWAMEEEDLQPDLVTLGKGIGSGVSVSAVCGRKEVFDCLSKGEMSSTYGGNPVASAAVTAVLEIFEKEDLVGNSRRMGAYMLEKLRALAPASPYIGDVRGKGLVMGVEFVTDKRSRTPAPELIRPMIDRCAERGLLIGSVGMYGNVLRVAPPLVVTREQIDESVAIFADALDGLSLQGS